VPHFHPVALKNRQTPFSSDGFDHHDQQHQDFTTTSVTYKIGSLWDHKRCPLVLSPIMKLVFQRSVCTDQVCVANGRLTHKHLNRLSWCAPPRSARLAGCVSVASVRRALWLPLNLSNPSNPAKFSSIREFCLQKFLALLFPRTASEIWLCL
jgi:hypothetical protein